MQTANSALNGARVERWWVAERWDPPVSLNVKPSVHSHGDWSREVPATRFYLDSFRVRCVYVSFHFAVLRRAAVAARHTGGVKGGEIYFFQIFPRCLFDRWANLSRDERFDLTIFFFFVSSSSLWTDFPLEFWYFWEEFWDFFNCSKWFCRFETCKRRVFCGDWDRSQYQHFVVRMETKKRCLIMIGD